MNVASALIPLAVSAAGSIAQQVAGVARGGLSFARVLQSTPEAAATSIVAGAADGLPSAGGNGIDGVGQFGARIDALRQVVDEMLRNRVTALGIDLSEPVVLMADADGRILETGGHWDRAKIEQLLEEDRELRDQVGRLLRLAQSSWDSATAGVGDSGRNSVRLVIDDTQSYLTTSLR